MNLGDFTTMVSQEVKRGNSLDAIIPFRIAMAAKMLERNYTMQYMKISTEITLNTADQNPRNIELPADVKSIGWLRTINTDNLYQFLRFVDARDVMTLDTGVPTAFWLSGRNAIVLDRIPDANYVISGEVNYYTTWPTDNSATPWLCAQAPDVLLAQTMIVLGNYLRDLQIVTQYRGWREELLKTLMLAESEITYGGMDSQMAYSPNYGFESSDQ